MQTGRTGATEGEPGQQPDEERCQLAGAAVSALDDPEASSVVRRLLTAQLSDAELVDLLSTHREQATAQTRQDLVEAVIDCLAHDPDFAPSLRSGLVRPLQPASDIISPGGAGAESCSSCHDAVEWLEQQQVVTRWPCVRPRAIAAVGQAYGVAMLGRYGTSLHSVTIYSEYWYDAAGVERVRLDLERGTDRVPDRWLRGTVTGRVMDTLMIAGHVAGALVLLVPLAIGLAMLLAR